MKCFKSYNVSFIKYWIYYLKIYFLSERYEVDSFSFTWRLNFYLSRGVFFLYLIPFILLTAHSYFEIFCMILSNVVLISKKLMFIFFVHFLVLSLIFTTLSTGCYIYIYISIRPKVALYFQYLLRFFSKFYMDSVKNCILINILIIHMYFNSIEC